MFQSMMARRTRLLVEEIAQFKTTVRTFRFVHNSSCSFIVGQAFVGLSFRWRALPQGWSSDDSHATSSRLVLPEPGDHDHIHKEKEQESLHSRSSIVLLLEPHVALVDLSCGLKSILPNTLFVFGP